MSVIEQLSVAVAILVAIVAIMSFVVSVILRDSSRKQKTQGLWVRSRIHLPFRWFSRVGREAYQKKKDREAVKFRNERGLEPIEFPSRWTSLARSFIAFTPLFFMAVTGMVFWLLYRVAMNAFAFGGAWLGIVITGFLIAAIVRQGLNNIPKQPPHVGLLAIFGVRVPIPVREGWRFFLFYPFLMSFVPIPVRTVNRDIPPPGGEIIEVDSKGNKVTHRGMAVVTPNDKATSYVPLAITYCPAFEVEGDNWLGTKAGFLLMNYLDRGGTEGIEERVDVDEEREDGVTDILDNQLEERTRGWAMSEKEGPMTWEDLQGSEDAASGVLLKTVLGRRLARIPVDGIPTGVLLRVFSLDWKQPSTLPLSRREALEWESTWRSRWDALTGPKQKKVIEALKLRKRLIEKARSGEGSFIVPQNGIKILRLNIGQITQSVVVREAANQIAVEEAQRDSERVQAKNFVALTRFTAMHLKVSRDRAAQLTLVDRNKAGLNIRRNEVDVGSEARDLIDGITDPAQKVLAAGATTLFTGLFARNGGSSPSSSSGPASSDDDASKGGDS